VNTHCATKEAAIARLHGVINEVIDNHRFGVDWLCCMPVRFSLIKFGRQCQFKPPLPDGLLKSTLPAWFAEADQGFFPFSARNA